MIGTKHRKLNSLNMYEKIIITWDNYYQTIISLNAAPSHCDPLNVNITDRAREYNGHYIFLNSLTKYISRIVNPHNGPLPDARYAVFQVSDIRLISEAGRSINARGAHNKGEKRPGQKWDPVIIARWNNRVCSARP